MSPCSSKTWTTRTVVLILANSVLITVLLVDGVSQLYVLPVLNFCVLHYCIYLPVEGHPSDRRMYDFMNTEFYWPHMVNYMYATVHDCSMYERNIHSTQINRKRRLFPSTGAVELVVTDIFGRLPKKRSGCLFIRVITNRL